MIPAVLPQIIVGMRIGLGVAWLVVVAAEMIALRSGLGYLIMDSRNAGNRYDLVIAGMIIIGLIGLLLDGVMRLLERLKIGEVALCPLSKIVVDDVSKSFARTGRAAGRRRRRASTSATASSSPSSALGLRQVDADEHHRRLRARRRAARSRSTASKRTGPSRKGIVISQHGSVFPWLTVQQNLMFGLNGDQPPATRRRSPTTTPRWSGSRASRRATRTSSRAAC